MSFEMFLIYYLLELGKQKRRNELQLHNSKDALATDIA